MAHPSDIPPISLGPLFETIMDNQEHLPINTTMTKNVWQTTGYQPKEPSQLEDAMRPRQGAPKAEPMITKSAYL